MEPGIRRTRSLASTPLALSLAGVAAAAAIGFLTTQVDLAVAGVGLITLLPLFSHVRWVGARRALTEPSVITLILFFYLCVFPQRGLAIALNDFVDIQFVSFVSESDLVSLLVLASLATAALIEGFHYIRTRNGDEETHQPLSLSSKRGVIALASGLGFAAVLSLGVIIVQQGGIANASATFISHNKEAAENAKSLATSGWATLAVPAVWCAALVVADRSAPTPLRLGFSALALILLIAKLLIFGSRLDVLLALTGAWVIAHYMGWRTPPAAVLAALPVMILASIQVVGEREGGDLTGLSTYEQFSQIASYGVLDAALAVRSDPELVESQLVKPQRWEDFPGYLVPSSIWPTKPNLDEQRLDVFVAKAYGDVSQRNTGFPTGYITELWLYGGWVLVLVASFAGGALLGAIHRRIVRFWGQSRLPSSLIWYCVLVTAAFSYFKDGDILMSALSTTKLVVYLAFAMAVTGVWMPFRHGSPSTTSVLHDRMPGSVT